MFGFRRAIKTTIYRCSACNGIIPKGCSCYGGSWWLKQDGNWEWREHKNKDKYFASTGDGGIARFTR